MAKLTCIYNNIRVIKLYIIIIFELFYDILIVILR